MLIDKGTKYYPLRKMIFEIDKYIFDGKDIQCFLQCFATAYLPYTQCVTGL